MKALALALPLLGASVAFLPSVPPAHPAAAYPFAVGEEFEFSAKLGVLRLGTARMAVTGIDTVRGVESFVFVFGLDVERSHVVDRNQRFDFPPFLPGPG